MALSLILLACYALQGYSLTEIWLDPQESQRLKRELMKVDLRGYEQKESRRTINEQKVSAFEDQSLAAFFLANVTSLLNIGAAIRTSPIIRIRGIDFGPIAPTTNCTKERALHPTPVPEAFVAGIARLLRSRLVGYEEEEIYSHPLFHDIRPVKGGMEGSNGDGKEMHAHMDMSYHECRPDFLMLAALREGPDPNVKTPFVESKMLFEKLVERYPGDIGVLRDNRSFDIRTPTSAGARKVMMPLLTGDSDLPVFYLRAVHDRMAPQNEAAKRALHHLQEIIQEIENTDVHMEYGDFVLMNNYLVLHRRSEFKPSFTIEDRLLLRAYAKVGFVLPGRLFGNASGAQVCGPQCTV